MAERRTLPRRAIGSEAGFSLPEILITIVIVGVTFTALLDGMLVTITSSGLQQNQATADTVARDAAEWVKDSTKNAYVNCAGKNSYNFSGMSLPSGYAVNVSAVEYWDGTVPSGGAYSPTFQSSCPSPDKGLQRITISASSSDGQATETVQIIKRVVP